MLSIRTLDSREARRESARAPRSFSSHPLPQLLPNLVRPSSDTPSLKDHYSCSVGQCAYNKRKNRYIALEPYDRSRVLVPDPDRTGRINKDPGKSESIPLEPRYLNASWTRETVGGKWWIAGQAPLPNTAHAFLTLTMCPMAPPSASPSDSLFSPSPVQRVHTIVQLTLWVESGRRKAHPYFPDASHPDMIVTAESGCDALPIHVRVDKEEKIDDAQCVKTHLRLRRGSVPDGSDSGRKDPEEWTVTHLLFTAWPDFGVPKENRSMLNFARLVEQENNRHLAHPSDDPNASPPILVHCSAGVGRTGSFLALCSLLRAHCLLSSPRNTSPPLTPSLAPPLPISPLGPLPHQVHEDLVAREVDGLREQRQSMVQREEQLVWVYKALRDAFYGM